MYLSWELAKACMTVAKDLLQLEKGENVLIYGDTSADERVIEATASAAHAVGAIPVITWYETQPVGVVEPPNTVAAAMKVSNVLVEFSKNGLEYTQAVRDARHAGARFLVLAGFNVDMMVRLIAKVNYPKMVEFSTKLGKILERTNHVRMTSAKGTDLEFQIDGRPIIVQTGVCKDPGQESYIGCQILWAPIEESINGTLVFDAAIHSVIGPLTEPVQCKVRDGKVFEIKGGSQAGQFDRWLASFDEPRSYCIAHATFGLNPNARLKGIPIEDLRVFGSMHFGIGSQSDFFKGKIGRIGSHADGLMLDASVWLDGKQIEKDGKFIEPELAEIAEHF